MALTEKQINAVYQLYLNGTSYRKISKATGVAVSTICELAKEKQWEQKKNKIDTKSEQLAEQKLIEEKAKEKAEYRKENLIITDLSKNIGYKILKALNKELKETEEQEKAGEKGAVLKLVKSEEFRDSYKETSLRVDNTVKTQDEMLFSTKKIQVDGNVTFTYEDAVNKVLDKIEEEQNANSAEPINSGSKETI